MTFNPPALDYWAVPKMWPDACVVVLAGGSNLTQEQIDYVMARREEGLCKVVAINRAGVPRPSYQHVGSWPCAPNS